MASGRRDDRPELAAGMKALREGEILIEWKLDRLGHDLTARCVGQKVLTGHGACRAYAGSAGFCAGTWSEGWKTIQDDNRQTTHGDGGDGAT